MLAHFMKLLLMLNFSKTLNNKFHSTESNAFSESKKSNMPSRFSVSQYSKTYRINRAFSPIYRPLMYAVCCSLISLVNIVCNLLVKIKAMIL